MSDLVKARQALGSCILAMNLARKQIDKLGGDSELLSEAIQEASEVRYS